MAKKSSVIMDLKLSEETSRVKLYILTELVLLDVLQAVTKITYRRVSEVLVA